MHEFKILNNMMDDIFRVARDEGMKKVKKVYVKLGQFTEINPEVLQHYFDEHSKNTIAEGAKLIVSQSDKRELILESIDFEEEL